MHFDSFARAQSHLARISNYDNEFSPDVWTLLVQKVCPNTRLKLLGISAFVSFFMTLVIYLILKRVWNLISSGLIKAKGKLPL